MNLFKPTKKDTASSSTERPVQSPPYGYGGPSSPNTSLNTILNSHGPSEYYLTPRSKGKEKRLEETGPSKKRSRTPSYDELVLGHLFSAQSNIDPSHSYGHLRSCSPVLGAGRPRGVRGGCRVATVGRIRVGSWNIGTLTGKRIELVDTFLKSKVDIVCVQETRWKGEEAIEIQDYKLWYSGSRIARNGVGIFLGKLHKDNVVDVGRFSDRIMSVSLIIKEETFTVISAYTPHAGLGDAEKKSFWELLDEVVRGCPADHRLIIGGDLNGHIGVEAEGYEGAHGGFGFGPRNEEGRSILEFAIAHELVVANSFFKKRDAQLATFHSGGRSTQIDFLLLRKGELRTCRDCKVLPALTCSSQHRLLVMDLVTRGRVGRRARAVQLRILWKNLYGANAETFRAIVVNRLSVEEDYVAPTDVDQIWNRMASTIRDVAKETLGVAIGTSRAHKSRRESWWLSDDVQSKVALKQTRFRELITLGEGTPEKRTRVEERYKEARREAKKAIAIAKDKAYEDLYRKLDSKEGANDIYRIAKARERGRRNLGNIKYIKDVAGQSIVREDLIRKRWEEYFASLFGRGRPERNGEPHEVQEFQNNCFCTRINQEEVRLALRKMGRNKAVGPDKIPIEAWKFLGGDGHTAYSILRTFGL
ncbi:uncharacterized protein [Rutidosis leptorrhynchoides]|uniref:uncharacterized protein n=1 Tax=Rutidosis leptorrhynchoides TaxID=125765 RepID=UPI003A993223